MHEIDLSGLTVEFIDSIFAEMVGWYCREGEGNCSTKTNDQKKEEKSDLNFKTLSSCLPTLNENLIFTQLNSEAEIEYTLLRLL